MIAGITAAGAIVLGEVIEKGLLTIPAFAIQIPLLGSLASLLGIFFGAIVSGIVGALAINLINRLVSRKLKEMNIYLLTLFLYQGIIILTHIQGD